MKFFSIYETEFGNGGVAGSDFGISKVWLPNDPFLPPINSVHSPLVESAAQLLHNYFAAGEQPFFELPLDLSRFTLFQQQVLKFVRTIQYGTVKSYGDVALGIGNIKAARAVGSVMASNPLLIIIPCHRVIGSNGTLNGYSGAGGIVVKKNLLEKEGVRFRLEQNVIISGSFEQTTI